MGIPKLGATGLHFHNILGNNELGTLSPLIKMGTPFLIDVHIIDYSCRPDLPAQRGADLHRRHLH
jgi:hypothetical protein